MHPMQHGGPLQSPFTYDSGIDANGKHITITIPFNNATRAILSGQVVRDNGCLYRKILIGLGADGSPDSTTHSFTVPNGTTNITAGQFSAFGFDVIEDILALQITAGF